MTHLCPPRLPARRRAGLSLIEVLASLTVTLVAIGSAAPGFESLRERRHLEGVAAQLETDLMFTRSEAVAQNRTLRVSFSRNTAGSCYVVHNGPANACACGDTGPVCSPGATAVRNVLVAGETGVQLSANVRSLVVDPVKGTITPTATMRIEGRGGSAIHQVINLMGRVRSCSPAPALPGYKVC